MLLRGGVRVWLSDEYQVCVELDYQGNAALGAAFNVVF
jgi:hypothetical protein